ncbi:hypothetical protein [Elioraea rosea]|uniref:hypothetical protein n=1 Tax=Elioraea rosea TaxID=2492390 RepID=UPI00118386A5|nr:hypothetical protein [Elioraea rosea]
MTALSVSSPARSGMRWLLAASVLGAVLCAFAAEFILREITYLPGQWRPDPVLGLTRPPHSLVFVGLEGGVKLRFDRHGLNNDDAVWDAAAGAVALIGDSFVEAVEVARGQNMTSRLAESIAPVRVLNLGRAAATPQLLPALLEGVDAAGALGLVVMVVSTTDAGELRGAAQAMSAEERGRCPVARQGGGGTGALASAQEVSALAARIGSRLRETRRRIAGTIAFARPRQAVAGAGPDHAAEDAAAAQLLAGCLRRLSARHRVVGALLPPVTLGDSTRAVRLGGWRRDAAMHQAGFDAAAIPLLVPPDAVISRFAAAPAVAGFANAVVGEGHLNEEGHRVVAAWLASALAGHLPR